MYNIIKQMVNNIEPNVWVSIISLAVAMGALFFNGYQLYISNKRFLFEKRKSVYLTYKNCLINLKDFREHLDEGERFFDATSPHDIKQILLNNIDCDFLSAKRQILMYSEESYFVFKDNLQLSHFFIKYADLLSALDKYYSLVQIQSEYNNWANPLGYPPLMQPSKEAFICILNECAQISALINASRIEKLICF